MNKRRYIVFRLTRNIYFSCDKDRNFRENGYHWVGSGYTREELVSYLAHSKNSTYPVLEHLSNDMSEKFPEWDYSSRYFNYIPLYYIAKKIGDKIVKLDVSALAKEIEEKEKEINKRRERVAKKYAYRRKIDGSYKFRQGSVNGIHRYKYHRGECYRHCRVHRNAAMEALIKVEYPEFVDPSYRIINLPTWDDRVRHNNKSWKTSYKVRKQWMKHKNKHKDTLNFDKKQYMNEMCEEKFRV